MLARLPVAGLGQPHWQPRDIDLTRGNLARMDNYLLDGLLNHEVDREQAEQLLAIFPEARTTARSNRAFLRRAVHYTLRRGVHQFLDLGAGFPMAGSVDSIVRSAVGDGRVVYVDNDPVVVAHSQAHLRGNPHVICVDADITTPAAVLQHPEVLAFVDFSQPVAVLLCAVLPFIPDDQHPARVVQAWRKAMAPGSYLVLSHAMPPTDPMREKQVTELFRSIGHPVQFRTPTDVRRLMESFEDLVPPGLVPTDEWHPEDVADADLAVSLSYAVVGAAL